MNATRRAWLEGAWACLLAVSALTIGFDPSHSPVWIGLALAGTLHPWSQAWKAAEGTALRGALVWAGLAIVLGLVAQLMAVMEPVETGRPLTGRLTYVMVLLVLAGLISVLGARNPGGGAWAILMALLVLVFLIPWLEAAGRLRRELRLAEPQLNAPWTIFYGLLVLAGVTNYLPTRYGPAAGVLGGGLVLEYLGLTRSDFSDLARCRIWLAVAWTLALSGRGALLCSRQPPKDRSPIERLWLWFRDHWGVVWALRVQERFNRTAELARWPARLTWFGLAPATGPSEQAIPDLPPAAEATLRNLLRRFVVVERVDALLLSRGSESCQSQEPAR
jgi:hypothetical protein